MTDKPVVEAGQTKTDAPRPTGAPPTWCGAAVAVLTVLLLGAALPPYNLHFLGWIALVPLLWYVAVASGKQAFWWSAATGAATMLALLFWLRHVTYPGWAALGLYLAVYVPLFTLLYRYSSRKLPVPPAVCAAVVWTALEYVRATFLTGFGWFLIGHTQRPLLPAIQIADILGTFGVTFVVVLFNATLVDLFLRRRQALKPALATAVVLALTFGYGFLRLSQYDPAEGPKVALVQGNVPIDLKHAQSNEEVAAFVQDHSSLSLSPNAVSANLIVWPETMVPVSLNLATVPFDAAKLSAEQQAHLAFIRRLHTITLGAAVASQTPVLVGALTQDPQTQASYNSAYLYMPDGTIADRYDKMHRVVFGEYTPLVGMFPFLKGLRPPQMGPDLAAGTEPVIFEVPYGDQTAKFATNICFEDTVPYVVRRSVKRGADFVVNISNDGWFKNSAELDQHLGIAAFRAVETRRPLVRGSNTGISSFVDATGRTISVLEVEGARREVKGVLAATVPLSSMGALYLSIGDTFAVLCLLATLAFWAWAFVRGKPKTAEEAANAKPE